MAKSNRSRCRTRPVYGTFEEVTGVARIVNGKTIMPGTFLVFGGKEGVTAVPAAEFHKHFEIVPEPTENDPMGAMGLAKLVAAELADTLKTNFVIAGDDPEKLSPLIFECIEHFFGRVQTDLAAPESDAIPESAVAQHAVPAPGQSDGGPEEVNVGYSAEEDRVVIRFARPFLGLKLDTMKARALAEAMWQCARESPNCPTKRN